MSQTEIKVPTGEEMPVPTEAELQATEAAAKAEAEALAAEAAEKAKLFNAPINQVIPVRFIDSFKTFSEAIENARARHRTAKAVLADLRTDQVVLEQDIARAAAEVAEADTDSLQSEESLYAILGKSIASRTETE